MIRYKDDGTVDRNGYLYHALEFADALDSANAANARLRDALRRLDHATRQLEGTPIEYGIAMYLADALKQSRAALQVQPQILGQQPTLQESGATDDGADAARDSTIKAKPWKPKPWSA